MFDCHIAPTAPILTRACHQHFSVLNRHAKQPWRRAALDPCDEKDLLPVAGVKGAGVHHRVVAFSRGADTSWIVGSLSCDVSEAALVTSPLH